MKNVWMFGSSYVIPNVDAVVLGGTTQKGNWNTTVDIEDTKNILTKIGEIFPSLPLAPVETVWVGLRPGRSPVRLDNELKKNSAGKDVNLIHCYGHGGSGVTLSVGCAHDVVNNLFTPWFDRRKNGSRMSDWVKFRSKL
jgi:D-amino-acid oxidase